MKRQYLDALIESYLEHLPKIPWNAVTKVEGKNVPTTSVVQAEISRLREFQDALNGAHP